MDELAQLNDFRSEVPVQEDLRAEAERLMAGMSAPAPSGLRRLALRAALAGGWRPWWGRRCSSSRARPSRHRPRR
ncbi:hypothetical protein ACNF49_24475 [Actinomadura sp. ATCC 39365]